jgi:hypothetical protein
MAPMRTRRLLWALIAVVVLAVLWYLFRPERLFINKHVNEPLPGTLLENRPIGRAVRLL